MFERHGRYILQGHDVVPCEDLIEWAQWFETANRTVAWNALTPKLWVSTVFLGLNHQWGAGPPLLFETMIFRRLDPPRILLNTPFDSDSLDYQERYSTWDEAMMGHLRACMWAQQTMARRLRKRKPQTLRYQERMRMRG